MKDIRIWKYPLIVTDFQEVAMPYRAKILTVQTQNNQPCIWAEVDAQEEGKQVRKIWIIGTGNPTVLGDGKERKYIGTCQMMEGALIWHVYEEV
jgi:hypothetical protein